MRRASLTMASVTLLVLGGAACLKEGIHTSTECQFHNPNAIWDDYGFTIVVNEPTPRNCPVSIDRFADPTPIRADIEAPAGTPLGSFVYSFYSATNAGIGGGSEFFSYIGNGRDRAQIDANYLAGWSGELISGKNQDRVHSEAPVVQTTAKAINDTYIPYKCCSVQMSVGSLPRGKVGQKTVLRAFENLPGALNATDIHWYKNGVKQSTGASPWTHVDVSAKEVTYTAAGTYTWKVVILYDFPVKTISRTFTQIVDP